jgi:formylglycine-generating enzyme required for sulfatase activity
MRTAEDTVLPLDLTAARSRTDEIFAVIRPEAIEERPIPERHRLIFYLGHLEAFDWNLICKDTLGLPPFHADFDRLFAFGIDPPAGELPSDKSEDWPAVAEILEYNRRVRDAVDEALGRAPEDIVQAAIEHRWMHAETLAYLLHQLPPDRKIAFSRPSDCDRPSVAFSPASIAIPEGIATLGRRRGTGFGWDNEFQEHAVLVRPFTIDKYKVTNAEYLEFVRAGGDPSSFWVNRDAEWCLRTMFDEIPLPPGWPVYVTHTQACAYAAWRGKRLPSEAEFHRAAYRAPEGGEREYPWGDRPPCDAPGNFDFREWDPGPVTGWPESDSAFSVSQLVGNGWEWTSTQFAPLPGFEPMAYYPGYSANFFDGEHYVLKGGSPRTAATLLRRSFRNWFRPAYPYVYATFRCVEM